MSQSSRRSRVCTRCRKRKTKCDFKFPACTPCKLAKVLCLGFDTATKKDVPRSLLSNLEIRVQELEAQLQSFQAVHENRPYLIASRIAQATLSFAVPPVRRSLYSKLSLALFSRPSCPPLAIARIEDPNKSLLLEQLKHNDTSSTKGTTLPNDSCINLNTVPHVIIRNLVPHYGNVISPQYPILSRDLLEEVLQQLEADDEKDTTAVLTYGPSPASKLNHFKYLVLFVVMAISIMTVPSNGLNQARAMSEAFYNSALKHLQAMESPGDIETIQVCLLIAHYSLLCPDKADIWACLATAANISADLGLQKQHPEKLGHEDSKVRARIFWVFYSFERSLCCKLRLPLSFPEESITLTLPYGMGNTLASPIDNAARVDKSFVASHIYLHRVLETELHRVLHLEEDLHKFGFLDIESWRQDLSARADSWYRKAKLFSAHRMLEFKEVNFYHLKVSLHRPTPRLRSTTPDDWSSVLTSSRLLIEDYLGQKRHNRLLYPWHGVHLLFETVIVSIHACWSFLGWPQSHSNIERMLIVWLPQCIQLIAEIGERWSEATRCAERLRPLLAKIRSIYDGTASGLSTASEHLSITEEIQDLLFPEGPLWWQVGTNGDSFTLDNSHSLLFDNFVDFNDLNPFETDFDWTSLDAGFDDSSFPEIADVVHMSGMFENIPN